LRQYIWQICALQSPQWSQGVLYANVAFAAACLFACGWSLWSRYKQGTLWLFRWQDSSRGRVLLPNTTALFSALSALFCPLAIFNITYFINFGESDTASPA
jgi:hypothetical protein